MLAIARSSFSLLLFLLASASLAQTPSAAGSPHRAEGDVTYTQTVNDRTFGPRLSQFMRENPDFGELVTHERFEEALALLETRNADPEVRLARAYVLSSLGRLDAAWEEAQAYDGPEPFEVLHQVAFSALNAAAGTQDREARAGFLEVGLEAATRAMAAKGADTRATLVKIELLREKAELADGPERAALLAEAAELAKRP